MSLLAGEPCSARATIARYDAAMKLQVNGETKEAAAGLTVRDLVSSLGLTGRAVAVEVNKQLVPKRQHESTTLNDGDVVEIVTLVGGG